MVNKDKIMLLAVISMLVPGAMPDAFADSTSEPERKPAKRAPHSPKNSNAASKKIDKSASALQKPQQ